jgi:pimeloyl-ACP methyl ester carboxylesterase
MIEHEYLSITGHGGQTLPNLFLRQALHTEALAVVFPGLHYTCDKPLLYYSTLLLKDRGMDVLQLKPDYTSTAFRSAPDQERARWKLDDARSGVSTVLAQRDYTRLILIGKSIGTHTMAFLTDDENMQGAELIWLTPLLRRPELVSAALKSKQPSLYIVGNADPNHDLEALKKIARSASAQTITIDGANHSLEIKENTFDSLQVLVDVLQGISAFLDRYR